ncbi:MAG: hypothetical protein COA57_10070 [Flavobacteriales bacterium]|nr:MAG: hypothetical protein COA57_10070 [Flavobacteriales bacterium]
MDNPEENIDDTSNNKRAMVMELSVQIEEFASIAIGETLGIEWEKSKSLGFGSSALSFTQKIQLIRDKKGIDKINSDKLEAFSRIRNKFAHVRTLVNITNFFERYDSGGLIKKQFTKWYGKKVKNSNGEEESYTNCLMLLYSDISDFLLKVTTDNIIERGIEDGKNEMMHKMMEIAKAEFNKTDHGVAKWGELLHKALAEVEAKRKNNT